MNTITNSSQSRPASARKPVNLSLTAWASCAVLIICQSLFAFAVIGHALHLCHARPAINLSLPSLNTLAMNDATMGVALSAVTLFSLVGIAYLAKSIGQDRAAIIWSLIIGGIAVGQMNLSNALSDIAGGEQPTDQTVADAFIQARYPAVAVIAAVVLFVIWRVLAARKRVNPTP